MVPVFLVDLPGSMPSTRSTDLSAPAVPTWPAASALPRRRLRLRTPFAVAAMRLRALATPGFDVDGFGLDDETLHADLADLFERRDTAS